MTRRTHPSAAVGSPVDHAVMALVPKRANACHEAAPALHAGMRAPTWTAPGPAARRWRGASAPRGSVQRRGLSARILCAPSDPVASVPDAVGNLAHQFGVDIVRCDDLAVADAVIAGHADVGARKLLGQRGFEGRHIAMRLGVRGLAHGVDRGRVVDAAHTVSPGWRRDVQRMTSNVRALKRLCKHYLHASAVADSLRHNA